MGSCFTTPNFGATLRHFEILETGPVPSSTFYGTICPFFNLLCLKSSIDLMHQIVLSMELVLCVGMVGFSLVIYHFREEIANGVNTLLDWETGLMKAHFKEWVELETNPRLWISLLGSGANLSIVAIILGYVFGLVIVSMGFDPLYFPLKSFNFPFLTIPIRTLSFLQCVHCSGKNVSFLILYHFAVFQAYLFPLKLFLQQLRKYNRVKVYNRYLQLRVLHQRIFWTCNWTTAVILYYGYTLGVLIFWMLIRGLDWVPVIFYAYFPVAGTIGVAWVSLLLTILGYIGHTSGLFLLELKKRNRIRGFRKCLKAATTIQFRIGSFQKIRMDATGRFLNSLVDNVTTAVLTF